MPIDPDRPPLAAADGTSRIPGDANPFFDLAHQDGVAEMMCSLDAHGMWVGEVTHTT